MSARKIPPEDNRYSLPPPRTFSVPGGPLVKNLDEVNVHKLAEIIRGGEDDLGVGDKR